MTRDEIKPWKKEIDHCVGLLWNKVREWAEPSMEAVAQEVECVGNVLPDIGINVSPNLTDPRKELKEKESTMPETRNFAQNPAPRLPIGGK